MELYNQIGNFENENTIHMINIFTFSFSIFLLYVRIREPYIWNNLPCSKKRNKELIKEDSSCALLNSAANCEQIVIILTNIINQYEKQLSQKRMNHQFSDVKKSIIETSDFSMSFRSLD